MFATKFWEPKVAEPSRLCSFSGETPLPLSAYSPILVLSNAVLILVLDPLQQILCRTLQRKGR